MGGQAWAGASLMADVPCSRTCTSQHPLALGSWYWRMETAVLTAPLCANREEMARSPCMQQDMQQDMVLTPYVRDLPS